MKTGTSHPKTVRLDSGIIAKIENRAMKENRNFSNMVETILLAADRKNLV
tara:strand:+ start:82090 stop:82239 length:150 start_codon:yes stop_codon:yes gene_type:complete